MDERTVHKNSKKNIYFYVEQKVSIIFSVLLKIYLLYNLQRNNYHLFDTSFANIYLSVKVIHNNRYSGQTHLLVVQSDKEFTSDKASSL